MADMSRDILRLLSNRLRAFYPIRPIGSTANNAQRIQGRGGDCTFWGAEVFSIGRSDCSRGASRLVAGTSKGNCGRSGYSGGAPRFATGALSGDRGRHRLRVGPGHLGGHLDRRRIDIGQGGDGKHSCDWTPRPGRVVDLDSSKQSRQFHAGRHRLVRCAWQGPVGARADVWNEPGNVGTCTSYDRTCLPNVSSS
jgi:hypothetical protein